MPPDRALRWHRLERAGTCLACAEWQGEPPAILLVHGLAGHAGEWAATAEALAPRRVLAPDQRGQGRSERRPSDVSRQAHVDDVAAWVEHLGEGPVVLLGQSLGGHTAFLCAAARPELVRALVVAEATPDADPQAPASVGGWLASWPVPFPSEAAALAFFGGDTPWARAWTAGLERRPDGLWPRFDADVMTAALAEGAERDFWDEWRQIRCPTLVVRGERGVDAAVVERMCTAVRDARGVTIAGTGHDLHLEQHERWAGVLREFLAEHSV